MAVRTCLSQMACREVSMLSVSESLFGIDVRSPSGVGEEHVLLHKRLVRRDCILCVAVPVPMQMQRKLPRVVVQNVLPSHIQLSSVLIVVVHGVRRP